MIDHETERSVRAEVARRKEELERTLHALEDKAHEGAERVQEAAGKVKEAAGKVKDAAEDVRDKVERSPWLFMAASLGIGIGIGRLIAGRSRRQEQRLLEAGATLLEAGRGAPVMVVQEQDDEPSVMGSVLRIVGGLALRAATFAIAAAAERALAKATERIG